MSFAIPHDASERCSVGNILQRIFLQGYEIRTLAGFDCSVATEMVGEYGGSALQCLKGSDSGVHRRIQITRNLILMGLAATRGILCTYEYFMRSVLWPARLVTLVAAPRSL
jgi:hypothetical protein